MSIGSFKGVVVVCLKGLIAIESSLLERVASNLLNLVLGSKFRVTRR